MRVLVERGRRVSLLLVRGRSPRLLVHVGSKAATIRVRDRSELPSGWADGVLPLPAARTYEEGLPLETGIPCDAPNPAPEVGCRARVSHFVNCDCDWDSLTFSFSELIPVPVFSFIYTISVKTKNFLYIYIIHTTIVAFIIFYTHIIESLLVLLHFTITKLYI